MIHGFVLGLSLLLALQDAAAKEDGDVAAETAEAIRTMHSFTHCVVGRHRSEVLRFLALEPNSSEYRRFGMGLVDSNCVTAGARLRFRWPLFRGGIYESLYHRDFPRSAAARFDDLPPLPYSSSSHGLDPVARARNIAILEFGGCVVRGSPDEARALLASDVASAEEDAAFRPLGARLSACLPAGQTSTFSRPILRGILAEALYGLSIARRRAGPDRPAG
jgi:hypothetical protein